LISIAIIDDDHLIVRLLEQFLSQQEGIQIWGCFTTGENFFTQLEKEETPPDTILLDLSMKEMSGVQVLEKLKEQSTEIKSIVISSHYDKSFIGFMLKMGIAAFLPKGINPDELLEIIREVASKGYYFHEDQIGTIRKQLSSKSPAPSTHAKEGLSARETEVLRLICRQKTAKEIGEQLFITTKTVEGHKGNLFMKTNTKNIAGLVIFAIQNEVINASDIPLL